MTTQLDPRYQEGNVSTPRTPEQALAEALHAARRAEYPGARGPIAVEWRYLTEAEREGELAIARAILAALTDYRLVPVAELERLTAIEAAAREHVAELDKYGSGNYDALRTLLAEQGDAK